jgi:hypothetical protein
MVSEANIVETQWGGNASGHKKRELLAPVCRTQCIDYLTRVPPIVSGLLRI